MIDLSRFVAKDSSNHIDIMRAWRPKEGIIFKKSLVTSFEETDLKEVKGVGEETMKILFEKGIYNQADLKEANLDNLSLPVFSQKAIEKWKKINKNNKET